MFGLELFLERQIPYQVHRSWGTDHYAPVYVYSSKGYAVPYPNPVSNVLTVSFNPELVAETRASAQRSFSLSIKLLDFFGVLRHQTSSLGENITIDVSNLKNGMYILQVHDGISAVPEVHKIIVNR